jgi:hypothetical protein
MNYTRLLILIELLCCFGARSQPLIFSENEQAHRRYWYYRTRFINDFVKLGNSQGDGVCFPQRNYNGKLSADAKVGPDQIDITNQYLSALALEYKLLSRSNQSTAETVKEIYYLLRAINRLDARADWFWLTNPPVNDNMNQYPEHMFLNGFILREDMPHNYLDSTSSTSSYHHFNYAKTEYNTTATSVNLSYAGLPEIAKLSRDNKFSNNEMFGIGSYFEERKEDLSCVHDKYQSMFIAFMLLVKYIPDGTGYYENGVLQSFQDGETDILQEVRNITNRCHEYIRGNTFGYNISDWILEYPDGNDLSLGQAALPYSFPLAKMICYINGGYPFTPPCNSYQDGMSIGTGIPIYNVLPYNPIPSITPTLGSEDAAVFLGNCMAGSNAPVSGPLVVSTPAYIAMRQNSVLNHVEWSELLRVVLHQTQQMIASKGTFANPINQAPCIGPYNHTGGDDAGNDWKSQDRLEHPKTLITNNAPPGNYPGVDYMLLHNLYYEHLNQESDAGSAETGVYKAAYNLMDNYDTQIWPRQWNQTATGFGQSQDMLIGVDATVNQLSNPSGPGTLLTTKSPAYVKVFQNLTSSAHIYAMASPAAPNNTIPSKVEYRAGKSITFIDGFEVDSGANFYAYLKRYVCAESDYGAGMRQGQNSDNDYLNDVMNESIPIHYVESPKSASDRYPHGSHMDDQALQTNSSLEKKLTILPNPSSGLFKVQVEKLSEEEKFSLSVYDMNGLLIYSAENISTKHDINLESYSSGIYMIQVVSGTGRSMVKKVNVIH